MSQHVTYHYETIGGRLYASLIARLNAHESFMLLGPRAAGKRHAIEKTAELFAKQQIPFLHVELDHAFPIFREQEVLANFRMHKGQSSMALADHIDSFDEFFVWMQSQAAEMGRPFILFVANTGRMAEALLCNFLHRLRAAVDAEWLVVGLSGEGDVSGLVQGVHSPFSCAHQYVLQSHDAESFRWFYERFSDGLKLPENFLQQPNACEQLFDKTGGDIRLLHHTLLALSTRLPITSLHVVGESFLEFPQPRVWGLEPFAVIQRHVESLGSKDLPVLCKLVKSKHGCFLPPANQGTTGQPHPLELMGLARRNSESTEGDKIKLASTFMDSFARDYFSPTRLGDLFAKAGEWGEAFRCYEEASKGAVRMRPVAFSDYPLVKDLIEHLCGELMKPVVMPQNAEATLNNLKTTLSKGLRLILGHELVCFAKFDRDTARWLDLETMGESPECTWLEEIRVREKDISQWVGEDKGRYHAVIADQDQRLFAVVVGNPSQPQVPRHHPELTLRVLNRFVHIWRHAQNVIRTERRLQDRRNVMGVMADVLQQLGREVIDVPGALQLVCDKLQTTGKFKRVAWFLCRADRKSVQLVAQSSAKNLSPLPEGIRLEIDDGDNLAANCMAEALRKNETLTERQPAQSSLYPKELRDHLRANGIIVPVKDHELNPIGVMLLESMTMVRGSSPVSHDLLDLGKRLASLIGQAERMEATCKSLSAIADPMIVLDELKRVAFVNQDAAMLLGTPDRGGRWIGRKERRPFAETQISSQLCEAVNLLINPAQERNGSMREYMDGKANRYWNINVTPIRDWFDDLNGHVVRLRNRTTVRNTFDALYQVGATANVSEALSAFFDAAAKLSPHPPKMARLYLIDPDDPDVLVSSRATGFSEPQKQSSFERGEVRLRRAGSPSALAVLSKNRQSYSPMIWQWKPDGEEGADLWTSKGLKYQTTCEGYHKDELEKLPGDFWIDFPLFFRDVKDELVTIGKITLSFGNLDELVTAEAFEYLTWMAIVMARFLGSLSGNEARIQEVIKAEEKAIADVSHNIATKVAGLHTYPTRYAGLADDLCLIVSRSHDLPAQVNTELSTLTSKLEQLSETHRKSQKEISKVLSRMKGRLRGVLLDSLEFTSLKEVLNEAAQGLPDTATCAIESDAEVEMDRSFLLLAFQELFGDSVKYRHPERPVEITIRIETTEEIVIHYCDRGRGVAPIAKPRIFEPFFRAERSSVSEECVGVGLYFVRNVIEAHHGSVEEIGEHGFGVHFLIKLPFTQPKPFKPNP